VHDARDLVRLAEPAEGIWESSFSITLSGMCSSISVAMKPGVMVLTVRPTPLGSVSFSDRARRKAASRARVLVNPNRPDFDAA